MKTWYRFGSIQESERITPEIMREIVAEGRNRQKAIRELPLLQILEVLHSTRKLLEQPDHPVLQRMLEEGPGVIGFSRPMVMAGIEFIRSFLDRGNLMTRLDTDFGNPFCLDGFEYNDAFKGYIKAEPRGIIAHISAGNVFVGAIDTLLQGIMTKNVSILKMAGNDPLFPILFAKLLCEADTEGIVSRSFALVPFSGGDKEVEAVLKEECDAIVVYGGKDAVMEYRKGLGIHTRIIEFGPKYSLVLLDKDELGKYGIEAAAREVAHDFTMWDQSACSSPHTVYVNGVDAARGFAHALAKALEETNRQYPHGRIPFQEQVEILRTRELARVYEALGEAELIIPSRENQDWTVVYESDPAFRVSCHHRTAYVKPLDELDSVFEILEPYGAFIQSVGILAGRAVSFHLADRLAALGADRITGIGHMSRRKHGTPHDGTRGTAELVRWVSIGTPEPFVDQFDYLPDEQRDRSTLYRMNRIVNYAREKSPFYREWLPDIRLERLEDIASLPILSQQEFRDHLPPYGTGLLTGPLVHSFAFGSGGTTGKPKFVYRTVEETEHNARALGKNLYLAGFGPGDIVANLLFAGNMWASFVSYTQALEHTGAHILPIAGNIDMEQIVTYLRAFKANCAISIPSVIISLAQYVEQKGIGDVRIEKILTGGEHLFKEAKEYIAGVLGTERFASVGYTSNDTGAIAFQCHECQGAVHHILEDMHYLEIIDPETGMPVPQGEPGKVVVTNLHRTLMPMIRYDIGDMGRIMVERCVCGRRVRLMELLGRSDDVLIIGGANIALEAVAKCVGQVDGLSFHFRMMAQIADMRDQLIVEVETSGVETEARMNEMSTKLLERLFSEKPEFQAFLKTRSIESPLVRVLPPNTLPRNSRTGKISQVVDNR
jgi:phenylacetate-coenzyme A ligase PaaK-like adenylate-forming protein